MAKAYHIGLVLAMYCNGSLLKLLDDAGELYKQNKDKVMVEAVYMVF
jgi:hypothetical protein